MTGINKFKLIRKAGKFEILDSREYLHSREELEERLTAQINVQSLKNIIKNNAEGVILRFKKKLIFISNNVLTVKNGQKTLTTTSDLTQVVNVWNNSVSFTNETEFNDTFTSILTGRPLQPKPLVLTTQNKEKLKKAKSEFKAQGGFKGVVISSREVDIFRGESREALQIASFIKGLVN